MAIVLSSLKSMKDKEEEYDKEIRFSLLLNKIPLHCPYASCPLRSMLE